MSSNNELKEFSFESCTFYYFDDIMRVVDINFDNILLDEKSYQNSYENTKFFRVKYHCILGSIKLMDLLKLIMKLDV